MLSTFLSTFICPCSFCHQVITSHGVEYSGYIGCCVLPRRISTTSIISVLTHKRKSKYVFFISVTNQIPFRWIYQIKFRLCMMKINIRCESLDSWLYARLICWKCPLNSCIFGYIYDGCVQRVHSLECWLTSFANISVTIKSWSTPTASLQYWLSWGIFLNSWQFII